MRKYTITIFVLLLLLSGTGIAQIYGPEGLNMPGAWNGWANPPATGSVFGGIQTTGGTVLIDNSLPTSRYRTRINVQASGGNVVPGTYEFLFTSGSPSNPWGNKWAAVNVIADSLQNYTFNSGANNSITLTAGYYSVNYRNAGYTGNSSIFMKTSAVPVTVDSVWGHPGTTTVSTAVTVNVKLNALPSAEEKVYVRYSTDNFVTASLVEVTGFDGGTFTGTAVIPGQSSAGVTVKFYALSTTVNSSRWGTQNADMLTLNFKKNAGDYFSYEVQPITSIADGNWSSTATWNTGAVPPANASVTINTNVTLDADATLTSITINSGKTFTASDAGTRTLTIAANGSIVNNGTFAHGNGNVVFAGNGTVTGTVGFYNVNTAGGINFGSASTVNAIFKINAGGYVNTNSPFYATGATLQYNTGGKYGRYLEWKDTTGAGYPYNVKISNGTILDLSSGAASVERRIAGTLTIDSTCALTMDTLGSMTAALKVAGNVYNYGRLILSSQLGGDIQVAGNFMNYGYFTTNARELLFNGNNGQQWFNAATSTGNYDYVGIGDTSGVTVTGTVSGLLTINNRLRFTAAKGSLTITSDTLVLGSSAVLENEAADRYVIGNLRTARAVGTAANTFGGVGVSLAAGTNIGTVTVTRYSGVNGRVTVGSNSGIDRKWKMTSSDSTSFASRSLTLTWVANDDNGKTLTNAQVYAGNTTWAALGSYQNASASRSVSVDITSLSNYTVSDSAHSLAPASFSLGVTVLIESLWNGTTTVQDTMTAELRASTAPYAVIATADAFSSTAGVCNFSLNGISNSTPYYLALKHRNSIETWSANPVSFSGNAASYNFTTAASQAYGNNLVLTGSKFCVYSGDVNQDGFVDFSDLTEIDNDSYNFSSGYLQTDLNGDLFVDFSDLTICDNNSYNFIGKVTPASSRISGRSRVVNKSAEAE